MKRISLILALFAVCCIILSQGGCQEGEKSAQTAQKSVPVVQTPVKSAIVEQKAPAPVTPKPATDKPVAVKPTAKKAAPVAVTPKPAANKSAAKPVDGKGPMIKFDKLINDIGGVDPGSNNFAEYNFKNVGNELLKIINVKPDCGCTQLTLKKKEYAPGESGIMKFKYHAVTRPGPQTRRILVTTNDTVEPKITLTLKARIVERVAYEPKKLKLFLKGDNKLPEVTLTSLDGKPFKITKVKSSVNSISAEFDPEVEATKFVLQLTVDKAQLRKVANGVVEFTLTHPAAKSISIPFSALTQFKVNPPTIIVFDAEPGKPMIRNNVTILNNYQEDFEIASVTSKTGITKVVKHEKIRYGHRYSLQIIPPKAEAGKRRFSDEITITVKGGELLTIKCQGFYKRKK